MPTDGTGNNFAQSLSRDEAIAAGLLIVGAGARVASSVRIVPAEDDGRHFGPVTVGDEAIVRDNVVIGTGSIIGAKVLLGHNCVLRRGVRIGEGSVISHLVSIQHDVTIGRRSRISSQTHLTGGTVVEDDVQIGAGVSTIDDNAMEWPFHKLLQGAIFRRGCRVGSGSTVLGSLEIGENTIVGAGSVVTRDLPSNVIAYGNPAYVQRDKPQKTQAKP
jgi:acetyltransferase-like isoleucine patch superfamily enzyme